MTNQPQPESVPIEGRQARMAELNTRVVGGTLRFFRNALTAEREHGQPILHMGPEYKGCTSPKNGSREVRVTTVYADENATLPRLWSRHYYVIASDATTGELLGQRVMNTHVFGTDGSRYLQLDGRIDTRLRGGGIASLIEKATGDLLQRQADILGIDFNWHITNSNLEMLGELQAKLARLQNDELSAEDPMGRERQITELQQEIAEATSEQGAWQHVYRDIVGATYAGDGGDNTQYQTEIWNRRFSARASSAKEAVSSGTTDILELAAQSAKADEERSLLMEVNLDTGEAYTFQMPSAQARREREVAQIEHIIEGLKA